ncbi:hypothetical protein niasHT_039431 [Heterodera trifolii]|uniref:Uncharacterized protein n=1 Tax=Heterodera trifolii TaxID=157864 RepID=A0ABD2J858_9BILA
MFKNVKFVCPLIRQAALRQLATLNVFKMDKQIATICSKADEKRFVRIDFRNCVGYELLERLIALMCEYQGHFFTEIHLMSTWQIDVNKLISILSQLNALSVVRLPNNVQVRSEEKQLAKLIGRSSDSLKCVHNICSPWSIPAKIRGQLDIGNSKLWPNNDGLTNLKRSSSSALIELGINFNLAPLKAFESVFDAIERVRDQYQVDLAKVVRLKLFDKWAPSVQCAPKFFEDFANIQREICRMPSLEVVDLEMVRMICGLNGHDIEQQQPPGINANVSFLLGTCRCLGQLATFALQWFNSSSTQLLNLSHLCLNVSVRLFLELRGASTDRKKLLDSTRELIMANICRFWANSMGQSSKNISRAEIPIGKSGGKLEFIVEIRFVSMPPNSVGIL